MIYFDNAATSFNKPKCVIDKLNYSIKNLTANPGRSGHILSQKVAKEVYETRESLKKFFNASNHQVVFTKNCTEALNLAIFSILKPGDHVITTIYEHNSVLRPLYFLKGKGVEVEILDCELNSFHLLLNEHIKKNTKLIITTAVSNVTGEICNIFEVGRIAKKRNVFYLVDGAQGCGHIDIDVGKNNIDMLAFAGHKGLLSITGVGGLIVKNTINLQPILYGGTGIDSANLIQKTDIVEGLEAGTIPSISILSLKAGVEYLSENFSKIKEKEEKLSKYLYNSLKNLEFLEVYSKEKASNVFSFNIKNLDSSFVADELNERKICVRSGLHCAPLIHKKLDTLDVGAVRVSVDFNNSFQEIDNLVIALKEIANV